MMAGTRAEAGLRRAASSVHNIRGAWIKKQKVTIENNQIVKYLIDLGKL